MIKRRKCQCKNAFICEPPGTRYFIRDEVVIHNRPNDIWVIIHNKVFNLTKFYGEIVEFLNQPLKELLAYAGKDISTFFNEDGTPKKTIAYDGSLINRLGAANELSSLALHSENGVYWWNDNCLVIGKITADERRIRIINTLIKSTVYMTVCEEDTIDDIKQKYSARYNSHAGSYHWRKKSRDGNHCGRLTNNKTLTENGIIKEKLLNGLPPAIWLYYMDDFTIA